MPTSLVIARQAAYHSGRTLERMYERFSRKRVAFKSHHELVTVADTAAEKIILRELTKNFPTYSVLSEESGLHAKGSEYEWIVDPLDGTSNFTMQNPLWGVSIALAHQRELIMGVVYLPLLQKMYWAQKGKGAFCNGKRIRVSGMSGFADANHTFCYGKEPQHIKKALDIYQRFVLNDLRLRHLGSTAFELTQVAAGHTDSLITVGIHLWDVAAGVLIAQEAGAKITDLAGRPWVIGSDSLVVATPKIHRRLLGYIR